MPEEKPRPGPEIPDAGKVFCSFCGGYPRGDGKKEDIFSFYVYGAGIPEGMAIVICPRCMAQVFESVLGEGKPIDRLNVEFDWSGAPKL